MSRRGEKDKTEKVRKKKVEEEQNEDDDWDSMYADDGECLNPDMMKELTAAVQNVQIVAAPAVTSVVQEEFNDEFAHVVEVSNFPVEFQTQDLMMLFMPYKPSGFEIKWVDDTHALVIFSSAKIAGEVVTNKYPGVRLKRLSEASDESKGRARRCGVTMQPYKSRPETCAALARRLVTGALGVKSTASKETLENERRILREAKGKLQSPSVMSSRRLTLLSSPQRRRCSPGRSRRISGTTMKRGTRLPANWPRDSERRRDK